MNGYVQRGYGFKIEDVKEIENIQASGKLSLWEYEKN